MNWPPIENQSPTPLHAFCPWFEGRNREWGPFGSSSFEEERNFQGTIDEYLSIRNDAVPIIVAVQAGDADMVRKIIDVDPGALTSTGLEGETALHMAAAMGHAGIVEILCLGGADVGALTEDFSTPLLHCARFCPPEASLKTAKSLLAHSANPITALGDYTPLYFALRRAHLPLAELLLPHTDVTKQIGGNQSLYLMAALDSGRFPGAHDPLGALRLVLPRILPTLQERDIMECVQGGGVLALDTVVKAVPPIMAPNPSEWLRDKALRIAVCALPHSRAHRREPADVIGVLDRALSYGLDPSALVGRICEYQDADVLKWAVGQGAKLTQYPRAELAERMRYLGDDWQGFVLELWDAQEIAETK
ncbi:hypothetical protein HGRIS_010926 [Hohenbuehelia grisea]|uniref:Uncharacterized protein n=1 Tax=Hohenbuehelia grisea TaxID=104357 RepID=A0ABR3IZ22_9AGAR